MDSLIDGFHVPKVRERKVFLQLLNKSFKDDESAEMRARDRPRRKERPSADPSRNPDIHNLLNNLHFCPPPPPKYNNCNYHATDLQYSTENEKAKFLAPLPKIQKSPDRERFFNRFPQEMI